MPYPKATHLEQSQPGVPPTPSFPELECAVLNYWEQDGTFQASVQQRSAGAGGGNEFIFYDGPPFANGLPHYGHLLTGYVKDLVARYQTMRGHRVERRFGWDTHGLPAELEAMRLNGIKTTDEIVEIGIDKFNDACRASVMKYTGEWREYVTRQARWVDFENDYRTMNAEFMESVLWAFKSLYNKGLVYEGFRVLPYCWNDETPLSTHELRMDDDSYRTRQDTAVTLGLQMERTAIRGDKLSGAHLLVWTTTPWTLPANLAVMVNPEIDYVVVELGSTGEPVRFVLAAQQLSAYEEYLSGVRDSSDVTLEVIDQVKGAKLLGRKYTPPFTYYADHENSFRVVAASFVTAEEGTGLVHCAPAFGEDDKAVADRENIEPVIPVGKDGKFLPIVSSYCGQLVFDANKSIVSDLEAATREPDRVVGSVSRGSILIRSEIYSHSYPHCWRCREPLIYKGVSSWFVEVTALKQRMLDLNEEVHWVPPHIKHGQFGKWLANARDWSITRNRFWGTPVPVWKSDNDAYPRIDVYGSFSDLVKDFGELPRNKLGEPDLHRPFIDGLTRPNPDDPTGRSTMRRVPDILDVWFDSGSMPFAQNHYPFENADWFDGTESARGHFPGDFIVEYIGQTRGWFYTLHVLATALFDKPAFRTCLAHGIVLGSDGNKMSKSLRNYPDVNEVFDRDGADAMRWFLMGSPILRGGNLIVTEEGVRDSVRQVLIPLWNSWYFFSLYANAARYDAKHSTSSTDLLDRYILAATGKYAVSLTHMLDAYEIASACDLTRSYLETLTNWYIRRSRSRFWASSEDLSISSQAAFDTLYTVLEVVCRVAAPLLPLTVEEVWRGLTGGRSVHLADWPSPKDLPVDDSLVSSMELVRAVTSVGSALRKATGLRNRLPLASVSVVIPDPSVLAGLEAVIQDELNVKTVHLLSPTKDLISELGLEERLTVNARAAGPRLGRDVQAAIGAAKAGNWSLGKDGQVVSGGITLVEGEFTIDLVAITNAAERAVGPLPSGGYVVLDTAVSADLEVEGLARDLIRGIQQARKTAGLAITDRVELRITGSDRALDAASRFEDLLMRETLAVRVSRVAQLDAPVFPLADGQTAAVELVDVERHDRES